MLPYLRNQLEKIGLEFQEKLFYAKMSLDMYDMGS